jgi:L,D-peptidoglycan transpeptidase YkuD (ErfK/YbiS/YcfS/YnhG family)
MEQMHIVVHAESGEIQWNGKTGRCAIGRGGTRVATDKREGDGATPLGVWPLRLAYFRPDKMKIPSTAGLTIIPLKENDGWCDEIDCPSYNTHVTLPHPGSHETLWREDDIYDVIVPLGYNDAPIYHGRGSAIFLHIARENYSPTAGCVAVSKEDLLEMLKGCNENSTIEILP